MASRWAFSVIQFVTIRPHAETGAGAPPVGRIGPRRDTRRIPRVWRGCRCLGVGVRPPAWGRTEGNHGGGPLTQKTDLSFRSGSYHLDDFYDTTGKAR